MLERLSPNPGSRRPRRRVGRGIGSGLGKTSGRGQKGAGARTGTRRRWHAEGGQMPLARRLPKRGFHNPFRMPSQVVNVSALGRFAPGSEVDAAALAGAGLIPSATRPVKVLGEGELAVALRLKVDAVSESARRKIEAAGGSIELVAQPSGRQARP
jgi:large subunit ribosomal protein L15